MKKYLIIILALLSLNTHAQQWVEFEIEDTISNPYGGNGNSVRAIYGNSLLYIGGWFYTGGSLSLNGTATWDGNQWDSLSEGIYGGEVYAFAQYKGNIYAGGYRCQRCTLY